MSDYLQQPDSDLEASCIVVESLMDYLKEHRTLDVKFNTLMKKVVSFAKDNISLPMEKASKRYHRKLPAKLVAYITELSTTEENMILNEDDV